MDEKSSKSPDIPLLVVVGAGPKAAALAAKARVLKRLGIGAIDIKVIERSNQIATNWTGACGFTTGEVALCTPPEKDVGFPYNSEYGSKVDRMLLEYYSWHAYKILFDKTSYSDWIDKERPQPTHNEWAQYISNTLKSNIIEDGEDPEESEEDLVEVQTNTEVIEVAPSSGKVKVTTSDGRRTRSFDADGIVFTGPGAPIEIQNQTGDLSDVVHNSRSYWEHVGDFVEMKSGHIAVIGGGESAASVVVSLLDIARHRGENLKIDIINRHGAVFTRGESYNESKWFSNPDTWALMPEQDREELIRRTDRGVFSVAAQQQLKRATKLKIKSGSVFSLEKVANKVKVGYSVGKTATENFESYDRVIVALGFNPWVMLDLLPATFRPALATEDEQRAHYKRLEREVDPNLLLKFDFVPGMEGVDFRVHAPIVAGLAQGPGFPSLCCLGHMSDRILSKYVPSRRRRSS
jgi:mycobactin lysine-N-oxygenase